jgi:RNA polymerase sigma factor (sigma-70 family)
LDNKVLSNLVQSFIDGDKACFEQIYELTHNYLYMYALKINKNQEDAVDLVQETYLEIVKSIHTLKEPRFFKTWAVRILINLSKKKYAAEKRGFQLFGEDTTDGIESIQEEDRDMIPEMAYDIKEIKDIMFRIIDELPITQRIAMLLYYYDEKNLKEIADLMNCTVNTVKSRLYYGRSTIQTGIEAYEKKHGVKLYSVSGPLLILIFTKMGEKTVMATEISSAILGTLKGTIYTGTAPISASGAITTGTATASVAGTNVTKIVSIILAGALGVGGAGYALLNATDSNPPSSSTNDQIEQNLTSNSDEILSYDNYKQDPLADYFIISNQQYVGLTHKEATETFGSIRESFLIHFNETDQTQFADKGFLAIRYGNETFALLYPVGVGLVDIDNYTSRYVPLKDVPDEDDVSCGLEDGYPCISIEELCEALGVGASVETFTAQDKQEAISLRSIDLEYKDFIIVVNYFTPLWEFYDPNFNLAYAVFIKASNDI